MKHDGSGLRIFVGVIIGIVLMVMFAPAFADHEVHNDSAFDGPMTIDVYGDASRDLSWRYSAERADQQRWHSVQNVERTPPGMVAKACLQEIERKAANIPNHCWRYANGPERTEPD